ncbi:MAG: HSP20 family protein, partial [Roseivirga sp.]
MPIDRDSRWTRIKSGPFHRIGDSYGHFFNRDHFMGRSAFDGQWLTPRIPSNIKKAEGKYEIEMALPGFKKTEISIVIEGDILMVEARKGDHNKDDFITKEVHFDRMGRNFHLDIDVNREKVTSIFQDGMLKIYLPHNGDS